MVVVSVLLMLMNMSLRLCVIFVG